MARKRGDVGTLDRVRKSVESFGESINRSDVDRRLCERSAKSLLFAFVLDDLGARRAYRGSACLRSAVRLAGVKNGRKNARSRRAFKLYQHSYVRYLSRNEICRNRSILCRRR